MKKLELFLLLLILAGIFALNKKIWKATTSDDVKAVGEVVVVDAGHGGEDPGKVGADGELEKDINLKIAKKVKKRLEEKGISVIMTRERDEMLNGKSVDNKKREDMEERVRLINEAVPHLAVSIHQNSYEDSNVSGPQVFYYSESLEGEKMAVKIQNELHKINENKKRQAKANDSYYLLRRTEVPTVIVECGFLSNREEAMLLVSEDYQNEIANAIVRGIESCFGN